MRRPDPIPVLCDRCRVTGAAGHAPFSHLGELLDFAPVPRRPRIGGWSPDVQRAFIAALAVTGSARRAAMAVGRAQYGVTQLLNAKGSAGFTAAYDRAMAMAADQERARLAEGVSATIRTDADAWPAVPPPSEGTAHPEERLSEGEGASRRTGDERERLLAQSLHRAIHGTEVPVFHGGRQVGTRRVFSEQLAIYHLKQGAAAADQPDPDSAEGFGLRIGRLGREAAIAGLMHDNPGLYRAQAERIVADPAAYHQRLTQRGERKAADGRAAIAAVHDHWRRHVAGDPARAAAYQLLFGDDALKGGSVLSHWVDLTNIFFPEFAERLARREHEARREASPPHDQEPGRAGQPAPDGRQD